MADIVERLRGAIASPGIEPQLVWDAAAEIERLRAALEEIVSPLAAMRVRAEAEGAVLNGFAYQIAKDPEHLKRIARDALGPTD